MIELLLDNVPLALLAAGLVLMVLEAVSPGAHFIVVGVALVGAGLLGVLLGPFLGGTVLMLALAAFTLAIGSAATWVYREFDFYGGKGTAQTSDSSRLTGAIGYATEAVTPRSGAVKLDQGGFNPHYSARTSEGTIEEGEKVIVLDPGGGNVLTVVSYETLSEDEIDRELAREETRETSEEHEAEREEDRETETESER